MNALLKIKILTCCLMDLLKIVAAATAADKSGVCMYVKNENTNINI